MGEVEYFQISSIRSLPIERDCLYVFDIDETIIHIDKRRDDFFIVNADIEYLRMIDEVAEIIYITKRHIEIDNFTIEQFENFRIPKREVFYCEGDKHSFEKFEILNDYLTDKEYREVFFIDDLLDNIIGIKLALPEVTCFLMEL